METLTDKQKAVLETIKKFIRTNGYAPTSFELRDILGYSSGNSITQHLQAIENKGYIKRSPKTARSIVVL